MHTNVKSEWVDGDSVFYDKSKNIIATWDGTNRKLTFPSGSKLDLSAATGILTLAAGEIVAADLATDAVETAKIKAAAVTAAKLEEQVERITDVTIASADVLTLKATLIDLIAAPGADKAIIVTGVVLHKPAGTAYDGVAAGEDLAIKYTDTSGLEVGRVEMTGFADQAGAQTRFLHPYGAASAISDMTPVANAALVAEMLVGEIATGDSDFLFRIYHRIVPTVLT